MPGIKPDKWIRRMAIEHGMIAPFEPENVRYGYDHTTTMSREVDRERINDLMEKAGEPPLEPTGPKVISYGCSSYGYDLRVASDFKVFTPTHSAVVDPKALDKRVFVDVSADVRSQGFCLVPPNSFALCRSVEKFKIPRDVLCIVLGKSSYARCGIVVNVTPLEPEWEGHVTIEISNTTPLPAKVYANEGIAQVLFLQTDEECGTSYGDKHGGGKYQNQGPEIVLPKL
jgi:dCTP deaminase